MLSGIGQSKLEKQLHAVEEGTSAMVDVSCTIHPSFVSLSLK